jgi:hypothetical protein
MQAARRRGGYGKRKPRLNEVLREKVEAERDAIISAYVAALHDESADHETRMRAADRLLDRVYGKPRQGVELSGPDGEPLAGSAARMVIEDDEAYAAAAQLRDRLSATRGDTGALRTLGE